MTDGAIGVDSGHATVQAAQAHRQARLSDVAVRPPAPGSNRSRCESDIAPPSVQTTEK